MTLRSATKAEYLLGLAIVILSIGLANPVFTEIAGRSGFTTHHKATVSGSHTQRGTSPNSGPWSETFISLTTSDGITLSAKIPDRLSDLGYNDTVDVELVGAHVASINGVYVGRMGDITALLWALLVALLAAATYLLVARKRLGLGDADVSLFQPSVLFWMAILAFTLSAAGTLPAFLIGLLLEALLGLSWWPIAQLLSYLAIATLMAQRHNRKSNTTPTTLTQE